MKRRHCRRRGATIIEFTFVTFLLMMLIFACIEFDRMVLVYTTLAHSSRAGVRYAIVHGNDRTGTGDPASGPADKTALIGKIKQYASAGLLNTNSLQVDVQYTVDNSPGSLVKITLTYPYDPLVLLPVTVNISSSTQGIIVF